MNRKGILARRAREIDLNFLDKKRNRPMNNGYVSHNQAIIMAEVTLPDPGTSKTISELRKSTG
jgi:hypothetical protein